MIQKHNNAMEVSAYVDGKLSPRDLVAFESRMAQDPTLRRRVEETRQVVAMMRAMPLRETSRNYLISPAMVAETRPRPAARRTPFLVMRVATSLAALAFAITSGLTLVQRGMTPAMVVQPREAPQAALVSEHTPQLDVATTLEVEAEVAPAADAAAEAGALKAAEGEVAESEVAALEAPAPQGTLAPDEELALAPAPPVVEGEPAGMGGGGTAVEDSAALIVAATPPAEAADEQAIALAAEAPAAIEALEAPAEDSASARAFVTEDTAAEQENAPLDRTVRETGRQIAPTTWLAIGLGLATALLAAITYWLSRRYPG
ncbi:MAG: hypothetical protein MUF84_00365 [Anaerolineae bacterium]|jgi:hypothetical protein|nr:hypothetical protein [Anaerolineae bacterium]